MKYFFFFEGLMLMWQKSNRLRGEKNTGQFAGLPLGGGGPSCTTLRRPGCFHPLVLKVPISGLSSLDDFFKQGPKKQ